MIDLAPHRFPWEPAPLPETVAKLQADMAYIVAYTGVVVHSSRPELRALVNTKRGQIVPRGEVKFSDGTTLELQDIGAPQVGAPEMTVRDLMTQIWDTARELRLEIL